MTLQAAAAGAAAAVAGAVRAVAAAVVAAAAVAVAGAVKAWDNHPGSVGSASPTFLAEDYRSYLAVLARVHLAKAGALRGRVDASDIVQDALLQAHMARTQFRGATEGEFAAWLRRILTNVLIDAQRRHGRKKRDAALDVSCRETIEETASRLSVLPAGDGTTPSEYVARRERGVLLAGALEALPDDQRTALELRYLGECTLEEIVSLMDRSKPSVAGLLRRGNRATTLSDVWGLGGIMYALLSGRAPFRGDTAAETLAMAQDPMQTPVPPSELNPRTDRTLEAILSHLPEEGPRATLSVRRRSGQGPGSLARASTDRRAAPWYPRARCIVVPPESAGRGSGRGAGGACRRVWPRARGSTGSAAPGTACRCGADGGAPDLTTGGYQTCRRSDGGTD